MRWLHLVRNGGDRWVAELVRHQAAAGPRPPSVVFLLGAARRPFALPAEVPRYARRDDCDPSGPPDCPQVDDDAIARLIEEHDRVAVW